MSTVVAHIDRDYLCEPSDGDVSRVGTEWTFDNVKSQLFFGADEFSIENAPRVRFRLRDEDNEVHYGGWLLNDSECLVQEILSNWGARDTGGFIIEIRENDNDPWKMEIG